MFSKMMILAGKSNSSLIAAIFMPSNRKHLKSLNVGLDDFDLGGTISF
jgi:hypothetical protein